MIRNTRLVACTAALFLLQAAVVHRFSFRSLRPDLLYLMAAYLALSADFRGALWSAFGLGLLRDLGSTGPLGAGPLALLPVCAGVVVLRERLMRESFWIDWALALLLIGGASIIEASITLAMAGGAIGQLGARALGQTAFTAALVPLLFPLLGRAGLTAEAGAFARTA